MKYYRIETERLGKGRGTVKHSMIDASFFVPNDEGEDIEKELKKMQIGSRKSFTMPKSRPTNSNNNNINNNSDSEKEEQILICDKKGRTKSSRFAGKFSMAELQLEDVHNSDQ